MNSTELFLLVIGIVLIMILLIMILVWMPEGEKQKEEVKNMSCKELQAYILHPKGYSDVAKDVYMVKCI